MAVLMWEKPEQVMSKEDWKNLSADDAPPGVYHPNMSEKDMKRWKATLKGKTTDRPQVEIRKSTSHVAETKNSTHGWGISSQILIIVSLGNGYAYKNVLPESMKGVNVQISMNGQATLTFEEFDEMNQAIQEARAVLSRNPPELHNRKT